MKRTWIAAACVLAASACGPRTPVPPPAPPAQREPAAVPAPPPPPPNLVINGHITACVVRNGRMEMVPIQYDPATGDTTVNGRPFREAYPVTAEYASVARWYADNEPITVNRSRYIKYGLPRVLGPTDVVPAGSYQGVTLFAEPAEPPARGTRVDVYYLPVTPDCQFQPYQGGHGGERRARLRDVATASGRAGA